MARCGLCLAAACRTGVLRPVARCSLRLPRRASAGAVAIGGDSLQCVGARQGVARVVLVGTGWLAPGNVYVPMVLSLRPNVAALLNMDGMVTIDTIAPLRRTKVATLPPNVKVIAPSLASASNSESVALLWVSGWRSAAALSPT